MTNKSESIVIDRYDYENDSCHYEKNGFCYLSDNLECKNVIDLSEDCNGKACEVKL